MRSLLMSLVVASSSPNQMPAPTAPGGSGKKDR